MVNTRYDNHRFMLFFGRFIILKGGNSKNCASVVDKTKTIQCDK